MNIWNHPSRRFVGLQVLRLGMAAVFLWFGFSQLINSLQWVAYVPSWAVNLLHIPPAMIVLGNGLVEVVLGTLMAMGFFVRIISLILAVHLLPIALSFGITAVGVRDLGLVIASLSLSLMYGRKEE